MSKKKVNALSDVAQLLAQFQKRLDALTEGNNNLRRDLTYAEDAIETQKRMNLQVTETICKLRDSAQRSFDNVGADVKVLLEENKRLNERLEQFKRGTATDIDVALIYKVIDDFQKRDDVRLKAIEAEMELIANVRKAFSAYLICSGPSKTPECANTCCDVPENQNGGY